MSKTTFKWDSFISSKNQIIFQAALIDTFARTKAELAALFIELGVEVGLSKIERSIMNKNDDLFPISKANLEKLKVIITIISAEEA